MAEHQAGSQNITLKKEIQMESDRSTITAIPQSLFDRDQAFVSSVSLVNR
jgi:hypothetical protein